MSGPGRMAAPAKRNTMRPPLARPASSRTLSAAPTVNGRASPSDSVASNNGSRQRSPAQLSGGTKRKERDFDADAVGGEETNINVFVRCRGRNDREVKENSGVVVSTDGIKGTFVELSMGPTAVSHKTYRFDKVFSPAADQGMIFDEVVTPILDEVLSGFNCTIFAYGQTGTGKTYTMSGDISDVLPLPDAAGIIPRALYSLFGKLEAAEVESSVKCSFIELYNEELRDLLSPDENAKLKIFEDANRKRSHGTLIQGVEESHIKDASKGIELLRVGSHKRQVAATKCNDLSSRSHTVFTITVYLKRSSEGAEDYVSAGKLNLVDLAGSENIQRSGAENKRAAEAGLINKSLLTLGRVINALVDKSSHIPYRESKLTRLLQDSLGGRTKTCIIATLSPAKSNLEETISTLDYAFRAKNIRNKPQVNQLLSKKTLLREFASEIEKLKSELIATRQRNGVYLTAESYEELMTESESRRILSEEQKDKIETMEANLRNKVHELFSITTSFQNLKKDNDAVKQVLNGTKTLLEKTEVVLAHTRKTLSEEAMLREAHQATETNLTNIGQDLLATLGKTVSDIGGLHSKNRRKSELQSLNRTNWTASQAQVSNTTNIVENRMGDFEQQHKSMMVSMSKRIQNFVTHELSLAEDAVGLLKDKANALDVSEKEVNSQTLQARDDMNIVLEEIKTLREEVKQKVGEGLDGLSAAAQRISAGVITELEGLHTQLHSSYSSLGKDLKNTFDDLVARLNSQQSESEDLRRQLSDAGVALTKANESSIRDLDALVAEEKQRGADERSKLLSQITGLVQSFGDNQDARFESKIGEVKIGIAKQNHTFNEEQVRYNSAMDSWLEKEKSMMEDVLKSRETAKQKIKGDWTSANKHNSSIQATTRSVHEETVRIVDTQMKHMDVQLQALDDILSRVRAQNGRHHEAHVQSLQGLTSTVKSSYSAISDHITSTTTRTNAFNSDITIQATDLVAALDPLAADIHASLANLRADVLSTQFTEYNPTGQTPQKHTYQYPTHLPRTEPHDVLLARLREPQPTASPSKRHAPALTDLADLPSPSGPAPLSPSKALIFTDATSNRPASAHSAVSAATGLRELDVNEQPPLKRQNTAAAATLHVEEKVLSASVGPGTAVMMNTKAPKVRPLAEGRENVPLSSSVGPGGGGAGGGGRVLRGRRGS